MAFFLKICIPNGFLAFFGFFRSWSVFVVIKFKIFDHFRKKFRACGARIKFLPFQIDHTTEYMNAGMKYSHFVIQVAPLCTLGYLLIAVLYIPQKNYLFTVALFGFFSLPIWDFDLAKTWQHCWKGLLVLKLQSPISEIRD